MSDENPAVLVEIDEGIGRMRLNRPKVLNAFDLTLAAGMMDAVERFKADSSVRVIVISGEGRGFVAGGDLMTFKNAGADSPVAARRLIPPIHDVLKLLTALPIPVIASVHGPVAGAGVSLTLACDLVIASDDANFTMAYSKVGTSPDVGATWSLPRVVGLRKAMELTLLSEKIDAHEALRLGIVNRVVPAGELVEETTKLARRVAIGATHAYGQSKKLLISAFDRTLTEQLDAEVDSFASCAATADFQEGISAFFEKRSAKFLGR